MLNLLQQVSGSGGDAFCRFDHQLHQLQGRGKLSGGQIEFIQIQALYLVTGEEGAVEGGLGGFEGAPGENDRGLPIGGGGVLLQESEQLSKEAVVEQGIFLELHFDKKDGLIGDLGRGQEDAVNAKGGLFHFNGFEDIALSLGLLDQLVAA